MSMPGCISRPSPYGDVRTPKGEVTSPRTGHSVGTPRLTSSPRSFRSTVSTANESLATAACPSTQASSSSARPASSDTTDPPPSSLAATLTSVGVSPRLSAMCVRRRASAPRSPSAAVVRARRSTALATWAISRRWRAISSRLSASRVRSPATSSRSAALRCSACHTFSAAAAATTTTSAAPKRQPCAAREMRRSSGMKVSSGVGPTPLIDTFAVCQSPTAATGPAEELLGVLPDLVRQALAPQHARQLGHPLGRGQRACRRDGTLFLHPFGDHDVVLGEGRDQRQVGDAEDLAAPAEPAELAADDLGHGAADAGIDLVEDERGAPLLGGGEGLEGEHDARQLAARGHAGERARLLARVRREEELDLVPALGAERAPLGLGETRLEARAGERERLELRGQRAGQVPRHPPPLDREPARPLGGGAPGRLGCGLALHHRLAPALDATELGRQLVAAADQVLDRAGELALQARELPQALLHRLQAARIGRQLAGVAGEALAGLLQLGERALEEGAHGHEARVEPGRLAQRDERAAEHLDHRALAGVEALLRARRQHGQALGVHQAGPLRRERLLLARHERGARQLLGLRAQHLGSLACGLDVGARRRDRLARRDQAAVAGTHLLERAPEAADGVEQLAVALDAP